MNIIDSLLGRIARDDEKLSDAERAAEDKAQRIKWHRENVRNGPITFKTISAGQLRRGEARDRRRQAQRTQRGMRRRFLSGQREEAYLRGRLLTAGLIPTVGGNFLTGVSPALRENAVKSLIEEYGPKLPDAGLHDLLAGRYEGAALALAGQSYANLQQAKAAEAKRRESARLERDLRDKDAALKNPANA